MARSTSAAAKNSRLNWPPGWEAEAEDLAELYERTVKGITEVEGDFARWKRNAAKLKRVSAILAKAALALKQMADDDELAPAVHASLARETGLTGSYSSTALAASIHQLATLEGLAQHTALDFGDIAAMLTERCRSPSGDQSTIALRFTIKAAATSYTRLFRERPGHSHSDPGPFGRFVLEIIARVAEPMRPKPLSPTALSDTVEEWRRRQPVVSKKSGRKSRK